MTRFASPSFLLLGFFLAIGVAPARSSSDFIHETSRLPVARAFHGTAVLGDFLYVFGGSFYVTTPQEELFPAAAVHVARVQPDGTLSRFIATTPIPAPRHYISNSTVVLDDTVYVLGGSSAILGGQRATTIAWTRPLANGFLMPWRESEPFEPAGVSAPAAFSTPGHIHLTGGMPQGGEISPQVWTVRVRPDGSLGEWERGPELPRPLWFHHAAVAGGRAYIWGGLSTPSGDDPPSDRIYSAEVLGTGKLGPWREEPLRLPTGMRGAAAAVAGPFLFTIAPRYENAAFSSDVWWTYVTPEGMRQWERQPTNIGIRVYHSAATDYRRGVIFLPGGKYSTGDYPPLDVTYRIPLNPRARAIAEQAWQRAMVAHADAVSTMELGLGAEVAEARFSFDAHTQTNDNAVPGFLSLPEAREVTGRTGRPLVMYFQSDVARPCIQQNELLSREDISSLFGNVVLASIDVRQEPQVAQQYGVFQVPTWILYTSEGEVLDRAIGMQDIAALRQFARVRP